MHFPLQDNSDAVVIVRGAPDVMYVCNFELVCLSHSQGRAPEYNSSVRFILSVSKVF